MAIKANIASFKDEGRTVVVGSPFFVETCALKDGLKDVKRGTVLKAGADGSLEHLSGTGQEDAAYVLNEDVEEPTKDAHAVCVVFGEVNKAALTMKDGSEISADVVKALRKNGIYAVEGEI